jgi:hypothetical protein
MLNKHLFYTKQGTSRILEPGLKSLRTIRMLEEGMVIYLLFLLYFYIFLVFFSPGSISNWEQSTICLWVPQ